ncbi:fasciclin domain-containing protein, partial [Acinetobacter baumannii]
VKVSGSGDDLMVNDAKVICGGVQTANATVYLVDSVLMPPAKK